MKKILIQAGDHLENIKRIFPLAVHLKELGYVPVVLLYRNRCVSQIFQNYGIKAIFIDDYLKNIKFYTFSFNKDINMEYKKIMLKDFYIMEIKKKPFLFKEDKILYRVKVFKRYIDALYKIINNFKFHYIFIWNGFTGNVANGLRTITSKRNIPTFFMERSLWKEGLFVDPIGVNGASNIASLKVIPKVNIIKDLYWEEKKDIIKKYLVKKKVVFIPLQVEDDTNIHLYSPHIKKMKDLVEIVINSFDKNTLVVVRPHPEERKDIIHKFNFDNLIYTSDGSLEDWIRVSDIIVTVNSTVGLEAILKGKVVITLGKSIYCQKGLTIDTSIENFKKDIKRAEFFEPIKEEVEKYYNYLYLNNTVTIDNFPLVLKKLMKNKQYKNVLKEVCFYKNFKNKKYQYVFIYVELSDFNVNLSYRNNKILITKEYIMEGISEYLNNMKIEYENIQIRTISSFKKLKNDSLYILISDLQNIKKISLNKYNIILNKYFMEIKK